MMLRSNHHAPYKDKANRIHEDVGARYMTKREFLTFCRTWFCFLLCPRFFCFPETARAQTARKGFIRAKLSPYFTVSGMVQVQCDLCPRQCRISEGERGFCGARENRDGKLFSLVYGNPCAFYLDPIEKESLFHVLPGTTALTLSTAGCNLKCKFCENWEISQAFPEDIYNYDIPPKMVVKKARESGAHAITYAYAEPTIFYEYMYDIARYAKKEGLLNVMHSNGFINPGPLRSLCKVLDAAQIDLKGFTEEFYREVSKGSLDPVLKTLKILKSENIHLEITNLVIPTKNDDLSLITEMCSWVKHELGPNTPIHFSRFYPLHKLQHLPATPVSTLEKARAAAIASGLNYVYIGKVPGHEAWNTYCPHCDRIVIHRTGYMIKEIHLLNGKCEYCGERIPGIWY